MLREKMDRGFEEVKKDINEIKYDLNAVKEDLNVVKGEMRMGFKGMMAESAAADEKMDKKADKKDLLILKKRANKLEAAR